LPWASLSFLIGSVLGYCPYSADASCNADETYNGTENSAKQIIVAAPPVVQDDGVGLELQKATASQENAEN